VILGEVVRELVGRDAERDDEGQVEQQLERVAARCASSGSRPDMRATRWASGDDTQLTV
jgi:hypothetical protein